MAKKEQTFEERALELVANMTLEEKVSQLGISSAAIPRLGLPSFHFCNEAAHGLFMLGYINDKEYDVTSYPVCLNMSQSWDVEKIKEVGDAISDEARGYANLRGGDEIHLNFFTPTVNMGRDPRNGRADEALGEDPLLAGKMAAGYIKGLQGEDCKYKKANATPKHYALNSGENNRHYGNACADEATIREYYAKVFEYCIKEGGAASVMTSYNRVNGVPASANEFLLSTLLREEWGFDGFVVSDCGAVGDMFYNPLMNGNAERVGHTSYYAQNDEEASAMTISAGLDMCCGPEQKKHLTGAIKHGLVSEDIVDRAVVRNLTSRFNLGLFDDPKLVPYSGIGQEQICSKHNKELAVKMAEDSIVLLKNEKELLPVKKEKGKKIVVIGPNAMYRQLGGYSAGSNNPLIDTDVNIMAYDGIKNYLADAECEILFEKGWCTASEFEVKEDALAAMAALPGVDIGELIKDMIGVDVDAKSVLSQYSAEPRYPREDPDYQKDDALLLNRALTAAKTADLVIVIAGTDESTCAEEHDRENLELPYGQNDKIKEILAVNSNTVVVLTTPGMVEGDFLDQAHTLIYAGFAGEAQGTAIANIIFGEVNPNAKLTTTWYKSGADLPALNDYGIKKQDTLNWVGRTYMYFDGDIRFPFGYGLSYTNYEYSNLEVELPDVVSGGDLKVSVDVKNTGMRAGKEIVEIYLTKLFDTPLGNNNNVRQLKGFAKVELEPGQSKNVKISIPISDLTFWSNFYKTMIVKEGKYLLEAGASSQDIRLSEEFTLVGKWNAKLFNVYTDYSKRIMNVGEKSEISVSVTLEDARHLKTDEYEVRYESSDTEIAEVSDDGIITAKNKGTASIKVTVCYDEESRSSIHAVAVR